MSHLGYLEGVGYLEHNNEKLADVAYRLDVWQPRFLKEGNGVLIGNANDLHRVFSSARNNLHLVLNDGKKVQIVLTRVSGEHGEFSTSGEIPGF